MKEIEELLEDIIEKEQSCYFKIPEKWNRSPKSPYHQGRNPAPVCREGTDLTGINNS
jgi:hypothetical protein